MKKHHSNLTSRRPKKREQIFKKDSAPIKFKLFEWSKTTMSPELQQFGGIFQPLRTALHTIIVSLQNSFCELHIWGLVSSKALRAMNAHWALPVHPVFVGQRTNGSENIGQKNSKKAGRTNITARDFVGEQLNINGW